MNYKGIVFENSIEGWKKWLEEFPNPFNAEECFQKVYHWNNNNSDYYIALTIADSPEGNFLGITIREWVDGDFEYICNDEEEEKVKKHFSNHIERYKEKFDVKE